MDRVATATSFLVIMIFLAAAALLWLTPYTLHTKEYGIILRFEGDKPIINGKEIYKDVVGSVIIKLGNEFQSIDVCELIKEKVIHISFSEGVKYWIETLEELGIKPGMYQ